MQAIFKKQQSLDTAYQNLSPFVNPHTGIVEWVRPLDTPYAKDAFSIYIAKHPLSNTINSYRDLLSHSATSSSAIAETPDMAKKLALCEAFERWSCVNQGNEVAIRASIRSLGKQAISPAELHCISERQYENRLTINEQEQTGGGYVPERLPDDEEVLWCPVFDLVNKIWKYALKSSCFFGYNDNGHHYALADSRGVAAGPDREFCVWQALLELIETDAGAIWNANRLLCPEVDIASFEDDYLLTLLNVHNDLGRDVWAMDISMDIAGVTVMVVISCDRSTGRIIKGFGTHPVATKALKKAIMECCQMLPNVMRVEKERGNTPKAEHTLKPAPAIYVDSSQHFRPSPTKKTRTAHDYPSEPGVRTIYDLVCALQQQGITPYMQNVSRPEINFCVMRVFAPGMRPWFPRTRSGRLYDVPVRLNLQTERLREKDLFHIPIEK
ncbi:MAG: YcaO-like family protein [Bacteroidota bacterium]